MSDIVERAKEALAETKCSDEMMDFFRVGLVRELAGELYRLHCWAGLMELLDEHWPEDIFPTVEGDDERRDAGVRIVSLLRWVNQLREELAENVGVMNALRRQRDAAESKLAAIRPFAEAWADPNAGDAILAILDGDKR